METTKKFEELEHSSVKLTVTIPKKDVKKNYDELITQYAKTIQLPGFRKGKVPISILERKYGEALKQDATSDIVEKAVEQVFTDLDKNDAEHRPLPYARPTMDEFPPIDFDKDLVFSIKYDVMPKVKVEGLDKVSIKEPQVSVGDAELKEELENIRQRNAMVIDKKDDEKAAKDDVVTIDYFEVDDSDKEIEGSKREDFVFTIGTEQNIFKIDNDIIGMKKGDTKVISKKFAKDDENKELAGTTKKVSVTIKALKVRNLPDLDDELAQDVNEKYKNLADLKADITKNLNTALENRMREIKASAILDQLVEKNAIVLPKSMIEAEKESRWRMMAQQFQMSPDQLESMLTGSGQTKEAMLETWVGDCEKMLKSRLIVEELLKMRKIEVSDAEIDAEYEKIGAEANISAEEVKKHYADAQRKEYLIDDIREKKLYTQLFSEVKIGKGDKTSFADLFKKQ